MSLLLLLTYDTGRAFPSRRKPRRIKELVDEDWIWIWEANQEDEDRWDLENIKIDARNR